MAEYSIHLNPAPACNSLEQYCNEIGLFAEKLKSDGKPFKSFVSMAMELIEKSDAFELLTRFDKAASILHVDVKCSKRLRWLFDNFEELK